jgi:hypothetical protein
VGGYLLFLLLRLFLNRKPEKRGHDIVHPLLVVKGFILTEVGQELLHRALMFFSDEASSLRIRLNYVLIVQVKLDTSYVFAHL